MNENVYIFDVDGTLTKSRAKITEEHLKEFLKWSRNRIVYLASGSDVEKLQEQVTPELINHVNGVFSCLGNVFHVKRKVKYSNHSHLLEAPDLQKDIRSFLKKTKFGYKTGLHIETRIGMLNISAIGRNSTPEQREEYFEWDKTNKEREVFVRKMTKKYPQLSFSVGGQISIDICERGRDKSQIVLPLSILHGTQAHFIFFGDRIGSQGNDYTLAEKLKNSGHSVIEVLNNEDTFKIIKSHNNSDEYVFNRYIEILRSITKDKDNKEFYPLQRKFSKETDPLYYLTKSNDGKITDEEFSIRKFQIAKELGMNYLTIRNLDWVFRNCNKNSWEFMFERYAKENDICFKQ